MRETPPFPASCTLAIALRITLYGCFSGSIYASTLGPHRQRTSPLVPITYSITLSSNWSGELDSSIHCETFITSRGVSTRHWISGAPLPMLVLFALFCLFPSPRSLHHTIPCPTSSTPPRHPPICPPMPPSPTHTSTCRLPEPLPSPHHPVPHLLHTTRRHTEAAPHRLHRSSPAPSDPLPTRASPLPHQPPARPPTKQPTTSPPASSSSSPSSHPVTPNTTTHPTPLAYQQQLARSTPPIGPPTHPPAVSPCAAKRDMRVCGRARRRREEASGGRKEGREGSFKMCL